MLDMAIGCALIVAAAIIWRLAHAARQVPRAGRVAAVFVQHSATTSRATTSRATTSKPSGQTRRTRETVTR